MPSFSTTPNPTTTVTTTTTTTTKTTTYPYTKPVVFKDLSETFVKPVIHQEPVLTQTFDSEPQPSSHYETPVSHPVVETHYETPVSHPVETHYETPVSHPVESDYETPSHSAETHYETPSHSAETHYETPSYSAETHYETPSHTAETHYENQPSSHYSSAENDYGTPSVEIHSPGEIYYKPVQESAYHPSHHESHHESFQESDSVISQHDQFESPSVHEPSYFESPSIHEPYNFISSEPVHRPIKHQQFEATTPHPLVFGFKPVASFVKSSLDTLEGVFGSNKKYPKRPPKPPTSYNIPKPPPFNFRQPKFFNRQPYQHSPNRPIRFPLGFFQRALSY